MNNKILIIIPILIIIVLLGIILYIFINIHTINYIDKSTTYNIKLINNKVIVQKEKINFSKNNNKLIIIFIKRKTGIKKKKTIKREELSEYELRIMESIIGNNEDLLNNEVIKEKDYIIETDMKCKTNNTSIYYIIDLENKKITKKEEVSSSKKTIYKKTIDEELSNKIQKVITDSINNNSEHNKTNNFYTIKHNNKETYIYNKDIINNIEQILLDLDYY